MKQLFAAAFALAAAAAMPAQAQVSVDIHLGDPGFYGPVDVVQMPRPRVIYTQPMVIEHVQVVQEPIYLRVPTTHRKKWKKYCGEYNACNRPVYFVSNDWYEHTYVPQYREKHGHHDEGDHGDHGDHGDDGDHGDHGHGHGKHKGKKHD